MGLEEKLPSGVLLTSVEKLAAWARAGSVWPATFGLACCAMELMATGGPRHDLARFGMEVTRNTPRQADLMIVAGRVSQKMAPVLRQIYDQMPDPKWVISMGVCASSGGMFNNYAIVQGVDHIVPVDIYLPGCPPRPEMLLDAILKLHDKITNTKLGKDREQQISDLEQAKLGIRPSWQLSKGRAPGYAGLMSETEQPPTGEAAAKPGEPARLTGYRRATADVDMYQVVYAESQRTLDDQRTELFGMRDRAVQFTVFIGAATAFLVGTGLGTPTRDVLFYILAGVASALSAAMIILVLLLLTAWKKPRWNYRLSGRKLIEGWVESGFLDKASMIRSLTIYNDDMRAKNEKLLGSLRKFYWSLIVVGSVQITVWAALVWAKG